VLSFEVLLGIFLALYFGGMVLIGYWSSRKVKNEFDYLTASQSIGGWVGGASLAATQMSAGTFIGLIGIHYMTGASWVWVWPGLWMGYLITVLFVAPRMRSFATRAGGMTVPDFVAMRYNSAVVRGIAAILIVLTYTLMMSAQYQGGSVILEALLGMPAWVGTLLILAVTVSYSMLGGMRATAYTDFIQQIVMLVGLLIGVPLLISQAGGWGYLTSIWPTIIQPPYTNSMYTGWHYGVATVGGATIAFMFTFAAAPYEMTRYYSMRDNKTVRFAAIVALLFQIPIGIAGAIVGMSLRTMFPNLIVPDSTSTIFAYSVMPPLVGVLVVLAVLAAIMSTVASIMIVTGSALAHDVYGKLINPSASPETKLKLNRWAVLVLGIIPFALAIRRMDFVQFVVVAQAAIFGSFFFVPVVVGMIWKRANTAGAIASMVGGFVVSVGLYATGNASLFGHPVYPGFLVSLILMIVFTYLGSPVPEANLAVFFRDIRMKMKAEGRYVDPKILLGETGTKPGVAGGK
jgi:SSS family transporter